MKPENIDLSNKIIAGIQKAIDKMVIESAAKDEQLVIADKKGNVQYISAKEALNNISK